VIGAAVLRPEPGNARTAAHLTALGIDTLALPLFAVGPLAWEVPDLAGYDSLLLTSANAIRHGGAGLAGLRALPVIAVGETTAAAARAAGFAVRCTGIGNAADALAAAGPCRPLHLAGRERRETGVEAVAVYASERVPITADAVRACENRVALLHSARAAVRFAGLVPDRSRVAVAALSPAVLAAAGGGWRWAAAAAVPTDAALVALVAERLTGRAGAGISGA